MEKAKWTNCRENLREENAGIIYTTHRGKKRIETTDHQCRWTARERKEERGRTSKEDKNTKHQPRTNKISYTY